MPHSSHHRWNTLQPCHLEGNLFPGMSHGYGFECPALTLPPQIFEEGSRHRLSHTYKGWISWVCVVFVGWVIS